jgi:hypothetical protein
MISRSKIKRDPGLLCFLTAGSFLLFFSFAYSAEEEGAMEPVNDIKMAITSLINPFISKIPVKKAPEPLVAPKPRDPVATPPFEIPIPEPPPEPVTVMPPRYQPPFEPSEQKNMESKFEISGIFVGAERPQAIVNGAVVGVGDSLGGNAKVASIEKDVVKLIINGEKVSLFLN